MNVIEILEANEIPYEQKENDNIYIECDQCGKDNLSINSYTGAYHCWSMCCENIKGHISRLFPNMEFTPSKAPPKIYSFTDEQREAITLSVQNKSEVIAWAASRSLDPNFVLDQGIGYDPDKKAIVFPYRDVKTGELIGARYRSTFYSTQWVVGREPELYVLDRADLKKEKIIIVEGEVDGLTLKQMGLPCIAILGSRKDNGYKILRNIRSIYLGYDMDGAGEAGVEKAASILGRYRCKRVKWTQKDPNDMLKSGAKQEDFVACLAAAESMLEDMTSISAKDAIADYVHAKKVEGNKRRSWGWKKLDQFTKGIKPGWCIYMMAKGNAGKTTFLLNVLFNQLDQGLKCGFASYEEDNNTEIVPKLIAMTVGRNPGNADFDPKELEMAEETLANIHLFKGTRNPDEFVNWVKEIYYVHGVKFVVADYLQLVARGGTPDELLDSLMRLGKDLCNELPGLNILWAVQPKQLMKALNKNGEKMNAKIDGDDARGGSVIQQACDVFLVMSVVNSVTTQYEFTKVRGQLVTNKRDWLGQITQMEYDHGTMLLTELETINYGGGY